MDIIPISIAKVNEQSINKCKMSRACRAYSHKAEKTLRLFTHKANPTVLFVALRHGKAVFLKGGAHLLFARVA